LRSHICGGKFKCTMAKVVRLQFCPMHVFTIFNVNHGILFVRYRGQCATGPVKQHLRKWWTALNLCARRDHCRSPSSSSHPTRCLPEARSRHSPFIKFARRPNDIKDSHRIDWRRILRPNTTCMKAVKQAKHILML
jgi:hypothetical protein